MSENQFGKKSSMHLTFSAGEKGTVLEDVKFTAPFKVMSPFERGEKGLEVMVLSSSAGIMEGDEQELRIKAGSGSRGIVSAQAYEKIHKMEKGSARRNTIIEVAQNAALDYAPLPVIPFAQSDFSSVIQVKLADHSASFVYSDIVAGGRKAFGELYKFRRYQSVLDVWEEETLLYRDNTCYMPEQDPVDILGVQEGFSHLATLLFFFVEIPTDFLADVRRDLELQENMEGGVSLLKENCAVIKILGQSAQVLEERIKTYKSWTNY